jgi:hypothetical protein
MINNNPYHLIKEPLSELKNIPKVVIQQKVELLETLTGCETPNRYHVYGHYPNGTVSYLFKCKEESSFWSRNCLSADARPFLMRIKLMDLNCYTVDDFANSFATLKRPFKCTCCCFDR